MSSQLIAAVAAVGLLGAGLSSAGETRAFQAVSAPVTMMAGGSALSDDAKCRVDVNRTGAPGSADITRQVLNNGGCVCIITTGQTAQNGSAEDIVKALLRDRTCDGAPLAAVANPGVTPAAAAASGGGMGAVLPVVLGGVAAAGLAVGLGKDSNG